MPWSWPGGRGAGGLAGLPSACANCACQHQLAGRDGPGPCGRRARAAPLPPPPAAHAALPLPPALRPPSPPRWHSGGPHFNRSLEWLLFTALEIDADTRPAAAATAAAAAAEPPPPALGSPQGASGARAARQARFNSSYAVTLGALGRSPTAADAGHPAAAAAAAALPRAGPLLLAAARLIACFPQVRWLLGAAPSLVWWWQQASRRQQERV